MNAKTNRKKLPSFVRLVLWVLIIQFVLLNISAFLHAGKLTKFFDAASVNTQAEPKNIISKTWRLFNGRKYAKPIDDTQPNGFETINLKTENELDIEAWYANTDSVSKGTVVLFHGLANNKTSLLPEASEFRFMGYNVLLVGFRGHGNSGGNTTTIGYRESEEVRLATQWLKQKGEEGIILWGTSMGAVAIIKAIADDSLQIKAAILEMPFGSLHQHMKARARTLGFPQQPFAVLFTFWSGVRRGFNGFKLNTYKNVERVTCPVLFQWGNNDHLVSKAEAENIYRHVASKQKKFVVYENGVHSSLSQQNITQWRIEVERFLNSLPH